MPLHGKQKKNIGVIIAGVIVGVSAIMAAITITTFVRRRRRRARPRSILSFSSDFREAGPELIVTPFDPYSHEAAQDSSILAEQEPLVTGEPDAEMVALNRLSSKPPAPLPFPQPETPIPVGLSDKEIARLRAEGFDSRQSLNLGVSSPDVIQSTSSLNVLETREAPYDPRRLHSEVETLVRQEMERLHAEGLGVGAPPSYSTGAGG